MSVARVFGSLRPPGRSSWISAFGSSAPAERMPRGRWYLKERPTRRTPLARSAEASVSPAKPVMTRPSKENRNGRARSTSPPGTRNGAGRSRAPDEGCGASRVRETTLTGCSQPPARYLSLRGNDREAAIHHHRPRRKAGRPHPSRIPGAVCSGGRRGGRGRHDRDHRRRTAARPRQGRDVVLPAWFCDAAARGDGSVLRGLRKHRGLSQVQVAESAGITQGYYSDIERGGAVPTVDVLDRVSKALDLDPSWMRRLERNRVTGA